MGYRTLQMTNYGTSLTTLQLHQAHGEYSPLRAADTFEVKVSNNGY
jgi:hypothetical protein